ncbi:MAG: polysaccharide ABC transporter ATP-binding protein [Chitinophagaceae bacterium]
MGDSIIKVEGLGKRYIISHDQTRSYTALRDVISNKAKGLLKKKNDLPAKEEFWALKDVSFEINKGETVGIIGRNGAGKSTLLKILSRITEPTAGRIELNGRVASLLEVGTGFHPELTGRENIFLNGAILGMGRTEIRKKFDEIVDFSGVEKFLDTPVKRYSSGMYVRLAFAVAAHLEPEILVVDEVLAVGDAEFQKKCLWKMEDISKQEGRTILFVSHNLAAIEQMCGKTILLNKGSVLEFGLTENVIQEYMNLSVAQKNEYRTYGNKKAEVTSIECFSNTGALSNDLLLGYAARIMLGLKINDAIKNLEIALNIKNIYGELVSHITTLDKRSIIKGIGDSILNVEIEILSVNYTPGIYNLDIFLIDNNEICHANIDCLTITVINSDKVLRPNGFPAHVKTFSETNWKIGTYEGI